MVKTTRRSVINQDSSAGAWLLIDIYQGIIFRICEWQGVSQRGLIHHVPIIFLRAIPCPLFTLSTPLNTAQPASHTQKKRGDLSISIHQKRPFRFFNLRSKSGI